MKPSPSSFFIVCAGIAMCLCMTSCDLEFKLSDGYEAPGILNIKFSLDESEKEDTPEAVKSMIPACNENAVNNLTVACYDMDGNLVNAAYLNGGNISTQLSLSYPFTYRVYVLGNCSIDNEKILESYSREDDLKNMDYRIDSYETLSDKGFPMSTSFRLELDENAAMSLINDGSEGSYLNDGGIVVCLKRLVCRYLFQLDKSTLADGYEYEVKSLRIRNAAAKVSPFGYLSSEGSKATSEADLIDGDVAPEIDLETLNDGGIVYFYCLENCQEDPLSPLATCLWTEAEINGVNDLTISGTYCARLGKAIGLDCMLQRDCQYYLSIVAGSSTDSPYSCHYFSYIFSGAAHPAQNSYLMCDDSYQIESNYNCKVTNWSTNTYRVTPISEGDYGITMVQDGYSHSLTRRASWPNVKFEEPVYRLKLDGDTQYISASLVNSKGVSINDFDEEIFTQAYGDISFTFPEDECRFYLYGSFRTGWKWKTLSQICTYVDCHGDCASSPEEISSTMTVRFDRGSATPDQCTVRAMGLYEGLSGPPVFGIDFRDTYITPSSLSLTSHISLSETLNFGEETNVSAFLPRFTSDAGTTYRITNGENVSIPYSDHSYGRYPIYGDIYPEPDEDNTMHLLMGYVDFRRHLVFGGTVDDVEDITWVSFAFKGIVSDYIQEYAMGEIIHAPQEYGGLDYYGEDVDEEFFDAYDADVTQFKLHYPCRIRVYDPDTGLEVSTSSGGWHDENGTSIHPNLYLHRIDDPDILSSISDRQEYNSNGWL